MKWINKKHPPKGLQEFQAKLKKQTKEDGIVQQKTFGLLKGDDTANRAVQIALAKEQGYICCYCMGAIPIKEGETERPVARIEHFKPRSIYDGINKKPDLRIEYSNLFLACDNNHNHCDILKDDDELCEAFVLIGNKNLVKRSLAISYTKKGIIYSGQEEINKDIGGDLKKDQSGDYEQGILNLNCSTLINSRIGAWKGISRRITKLVGTPDWESKREKALQIARDLHQQYASRKKDNKFYPFCEVVVYELERRFKDLKSA